MEIKDINKLTVEKLLEVVAEKKSELSRMALELKSGQLKETHKVRGLRKEIARFNTILREKQLINELGE